MSDISTVIHRRQFAKAAAAAAAALAMPVRLSAGVRPPKRFTYCAFVKFLTELDFDQLADAIAEAGFDGIEVTARKKESYIDPARAAEELPRLNEALAKRGLEITILTTDILRADEPSAEPLLRTAAKNGINRYRLGFHLYDLNQPILPQLAALQPVFRDIAALNRELGIAALYQNHCGADMLGATLWDLHSLIKDCRVSEIGCAFDIRHAAVEGGEAWPVYWNLMKPHLGAVSVKDFAWNGRKSQHVPLGTGQVDPKFFQQLRDSSFAGPITLHVEYAEDRGPNANIEALKTDFATLRKWMVR
ncbi:MAG: sugar phosphate isomerase/epimerase [Planctomycetes bacterium]|nr:sugar phosphate isomerase/epimerase [Planctomycetota bacterium]